MPPCTALNTGAGSAVSSRGAVGCSAQAARIRSAAAAIQRVNLMLHLVAAGGRGRAGSGARRTGARPAPSRAGEEAAVSKQLGVVPAGRWRPDPVRGDPPAHQNGAQEACFLTIRSAVPDGHRIPAAGPGMRILVLTARSIRFRALREALEPLEIATMRHAPKPFGDAGTWSLVLVDAD